MTGAHVLGGFSIDAVRYPDGSYDVNRLGGNAFWAALGAWLVGRAASVHAVVGADYPARALARLAELGIDARGVIRRNELASTRVTFSYAQDGSRIQPADEAMLADIPPHDRAGFIDNTRREELVLALLPTVHDLSLSADGPRDERNRQAWHLGLLPAVRVRDLVAGLRGVGYLQLDCPERDQLRREGSGVLREVLPAVDVFLPSTSDAAVFLPGMKPAELLDAFHAWGAESVVLKCGEEGAVVSCEGRRWHVPVYRDSGEFDPTGAGDVFGGACASAMAESGDLVAAAVAGASAASFATAARTPLDLATIRWQDYEDRRLIIAAGVEEI
ncbi:carbohydrate kinase family protein [Herbiconiux ginsengi]|uniref:Sugar or nucleoside kinase, ribokinase family n=1 Tax=Herbiconiux ginsengi TaxID=381665 RepID=A0A1H3S289_9MICO|nr:carbohydrate kinase family protein [Herbiconiux ginsengi]SDZ31289.1 Sugar or nucleoside kinase, ribokinase family [Herbiconiux ginsengi]